MRGDIKVLILGANGFIGRHILQSLYDTSYTITASSGKEDILPDTRHTFHKIDLSHTCKLNHMLATEQPDIIINCAAISTPDYCDTHRDETYRINVDIPRLLTLYSKQHRTKVIHLSTDFVFDGLGNDFITEDTETHPVNYYGETKAKSEKIIARECYAWAIARVVLVYGNTLPEQHGNIVQLIKSRLENKQPVTVVCDQVRTPTFVGDIAEGIKAIIEHEAQGYFHLCGKEALSIADIAYRVAEYWKLDKTLISTKTTSEMNEKIARPLYTPLSIEMARVTLNYNPLSFEESLRYIR